MPTKHCPLGNIPNYVKHCKREMEKIHGTTAKTGLLNLFVREDSSPVINKTLNSRTQKTNARVGFDVKVWAEVAVQKNKTREAEISEGATAKLVLMKLFIYEDSSPVINTTLNSRTQKTNAKVGLDVKVTAAVTLRKKKRSKNRLSPTSLQQ